MVEKNQIGEWDGDREKQIGISIKGVCTFARLCERARVVLNTNARLKGGSVVVS